MNHVGKKGCMMNKETPGEQSSLASEFESMAGSRRSMLKGMALMGGGAAIMQPYDVMAMVEQQHNQKSGENAVIQQVSEHARAEDLPEGAFDLPRWKPSRTGNYNLQRPLDNHYAFAKVQANLAGEYTFMAKYGMVFLCPPGEPAYPWLGVVTLVQVFVTEADDDFVPDRGEHDYVMWGTFSTVYCNPRTFEPLETAYNPYLDKMINVNNFNYADRLAYRLGKSIIVPGVDPAFYDQPWDRDGGYSQHHVDTGHEIAYGVLGSAQHSGPHQPRIDYAWWAAKTDDVMDPTKRAIDCNRSYSSLMKLSEYPWMGAEQGDQAQIFQLANSVKTQNPARLPDFIKPIILDRYPGRFAL